MKNCLKKVVNHEVLTTVALLAISSFFAAAQDAPKAAPSGASAYKTKCVSCHGVDGSGNTPVGKSLKVADLRSDEVQKRSDAELAQFIADGKGNMPSFKSSTSDDELRAIVAHIRVLGAKKKAN